MIAPPPGLIRENIFASNPKPNRMAHPNHPRKVVISGCLADSPVRPEPVGS